MKFVKFDYTNVPLNEACEIAIKKQYSHQSAPEILKSAIKMCASRSCLEV